MADSPYADLFNSKLPQVKDGQKPADRQQPSTVNSYDLTPPPSQRRSGIAPPPGETGLPERKAPAADDATARRDQPIKHQGAGTGVFASPELTAPARRAAIDHSNDKVVSNPDQGSWITAGMAFDYGSMTAAGIAGNVFGRRRVVESVDKAQGKLSEHAINTELSTQFNADQIRLQQQLVNKLRESDGTYAKLLGENPDLLREGPRFLYDSTGVDAGTMQSLHRPLQLNALLEGVDKVPLEKISGPQAEELQKYFQQMTSDPLTIRENLTGQASAASEKAAALVQAHNNLGTNPESSEFKAAVAKAEQEFGQSVKSLRLAAGGNLVTASDIAADIGETHPHLVEEVERFKVDPTVSPEQKAIIERFRNLEDAATKVGRVKVSVSESANTITNQGEHLLDLKEISKHPALESEGLVKEGKALQASAEKVIAARSTFNANIENELKFFTGKNVKVLAGAIAADVAIDRLFFKDETRGNKTWLFDVGSAGLALASRINNPWVKGGIIVGGHLVGRYFDDSNSSATKKKF